MFTVHNVEYCIGYSIMFPKGMGHGDLWSF